MVVRLSVVLPRVAAAAQHHQGSILLHFPGSGKDQHSKFEMREFPVSLAIKELALSLLRLGLQPSAQPKKTPDKLPPTPNFEVRFLLNMKHFDTFIECL